MKLIGKSSVASGLNLLLGVVNVFVIIGGLAVTAFLILSLASPEFRAMLEGAGGLGSATNAVAPFAGGVFACGFTWLIIDQLRRIFRAVNAGDAFELPNVRRLRLIGVGLIGLQLVGLVLAFLPGDVPMADVDRDYDADLGAWLSILIVFMLAEVFRQGADMRDEQLTTV